METFTISENEAGERIDKILVLHFPEHSRTYFQSLIARNFVFLNGKSLKKRTQVKTGDEIEVDLVLPEACDLTPENIPLDIIYEDEALLIIHKATGMVVHPGAGNWTGTLVNGLLYYCKALQKLEDNLRPGIIHRLDKDTSGLLVAAKNLSCQQKIAAQFAARTVEKEYVAICCGNPPNRLFESAIRRHPKDRKKMFCSESGKEAVTNFKSLAHNEQISIVTAKPKTGRTHQIRVHLQHLGHPVLGDPVYGHLGLNTSLHAPRLLLHAHKLSFTHPLTDERLQFTAPIPNDMLSYIKKIDPQCVLLPKES